MQRVMMGAAALLVAALIAWFFSTGGGTLDVKGQQVRDASQEVNPGGAGGPTGIPGQNQSPQTPNNAAPGPQVPADQIPGMSR